MSTQRIRSIVLGLSVIALCAVLTQPVLAAPPGGPAAPAFLVQIWNSLAELISGPAQSPVDEPRDSELRRVAGDAGSGFDPVGSSQELVDLSSSDGELESFSPTAVPEDESDGTTDP